MIAIMCTLKLQRALVQGGQAWTRGKAPDVQPSGRLGNWAATLVDEGRKLVVAINERTGLTLVLPFRPSGTLRNRLAATLRDALVDRRVHLAEASDECREVRTAAFARLRNPALSDALDFAAFEAACHGTGGRQDNRSIQDMLNEYPYGIGAGVPDEAVAAAFGAARLGR